MARKNAINALGKKERRLVLPLGRKGISVYEVTDGKGAGRGIVQCSMYPNFSGVFPDMEKAIERAHRIEIFHKRQLELELLY